MLTFTSQRKRRYCDGVSRRNFLKIGALATGGLTLADVLRSESMAGTSGRRKSIINIYLGGGPSHMDTFDLKPEAPAEYRGEFHPIATNVPGMEICEHLPNVARLGDKLIIVRSIAGLRDEHSPRQTDTGWNETSLRSIGGRPGIGAVLSRLHGSVNGTAPTSVALSGHTTHGFLPPVYRDYRPDGPGLGNLRLNNVSLDRLGDRSKLLAGLDRLRSDLDSSGMMNALDEFNQRAITVITSGTLAEALDTSKEDPRTLERYGFQMGGSYGGNRNFLLARRLVEVGVRVVSLSWGGWDTHSDNFKNLSRQLPALDVGLSALLEDLDAHGLLEDTIVMMSGEFGRTPRVNGSAGRDHWAPAAFWLLAGGGFRTGQVIGSTNARGEVPKDRPVPLQELYATIYHQLGVDPQTTTIVDPNGRPQYLVDHRELLTEIL